MLEELNRLAKEFELIIEYPNGETAPISKIYEIKGRGGSWNILVDDYTVENIQEELTDLKHDLAESEAENKNLKEDLEEWQKIASTPSEISAKINELEDECNYVQTAIENMEYKLGLQTKCRHTFNRIDELAEILETKIQELENEKNFLEDEIAGLKVDNRALAWQIEELEKWKENTLKDE